MKGVKIIQNQLLLLSVVKFEAPLLPFWQLMTPALFIFPEIACHLKEVLYHVNFR